MGILGWVCDLVFFGVWWFSLVLGVDLGVGGLGLRFGLGFGFGLWVLGLGFVFCVVFWGGVP